MDVHLNLSLDQSRTTARNARWERLSAALHVALRPEDVRDEAHITQRMTFDHDNHNSIVACISNARENARQVREKISSEMWLHINTLYLDVRNTTIDSIWNNQPHQFFDAVKNGAHLFQGITDSTMVHDEGWQFIQLGRFIERSMGIATLLDEHLRAYPLTNSGAGAELP